MSCCALLRVYSVVMYLEILEETVLHRLYFTSGWLQAWWWKLAFSEFSGERFSELLCLNIPLFYYICLILHTVVTWVTYVVYSHWFLDIKRLFLVYWKCSPCPVLAFIQNQALPHWICRVHSFIINHVSSPAGQCRFYLSDTIAVTKDHFSHWKNVYHSPFH